MTETKTFSLSPQQKLRFILDLSVREIEAIVQWRQMLSKVINLEDISLRAQLDRETVEQLLLNSSNVEKMRLNPNRVNRNQLEQIPQLKPDRIDIVLQGKPYYSMTELAVATALPLTVLDYFFVIPPLSFPDKPANKEVILEPVTGYYLIPRQPDFERLDPAVQLGYVESLPIPETLEFRIVENSDFESGSQTAHLLKAAFAGNVHPVLRDVQGSKLYLVPGSIDLWFHLNTPSPRREEIIQELGLEIVDPRPRMGYYRAQLTHKPEDFDVTREVLRVISKANQFQEVAFAEPDRVGFDDFQFDPSFPITEAEGDFEAVDRFWNYELIELEAAHAITTGSPLVTLIVIDSGIDTNHSDLVPALRSDWQSLDLNFERGIPATVLSPHASYIAHGTKVSGLVAGRGNATISQVRGVAPNCSILPIKISGSQGYGLRAEAILESLTYLQPNERGVINLSWRIDGEHIGIRQALIAAQNQGVAIVCSAGNYTLGMPQKPDEIHYPSAYSYLDPQLTALCSVAAVGAGDRKANYSYYGEQSVTLSAPGGEQGRAGTAIYTTSTSNSYTYTWGTSFAAPHVAGLIALLFSLKPELTPQQAIAIIKETADSVDMVNPLYLGMLGAGRINARAALEKLQDDFGIQPPVPPSPSISHYDDRGRLNINLATFDELVKLPLIEAWRANQILDYRETHGLFTTIWSLLLIGVFDPWTIRSLEPYITVLS
ncbi:S8 family serine peptidase [Okeania sp. SIO2B3]|uniref:S8 family serine peptidase n=1 Tax=Okeania sp. SIO2B3 TaxID=2607784 RepID=UPI0013C0D724|nr:S8 family serine peptidase [Okeania sp. SIO2B3]NET41902.1 S8 family serine peptidase [Okeania sp. SIO2B3]